MKPTEVLHIPTETFIGIDRQRRQVHMDDVNSQGIPSLSLHRDDVINRLARIYSTAYQEEPWLQSISHDQATTSVESTLSHMYGRGKVIFTIDQDNNIEIQGFALYMVGPWSQIKDQCYKNMHTICSTRTRGKVPDQHAREQSINNAIQHIDCSANRGNVLYFVDLAANRYFRKELFRPTGTLLMGSVFESAQAQARYMVMQTINPGPVTDYMLSNLKPARLFYKVLAKIKIPKTDWREKQHYHTIVLLQNLKTIALAASFLTKKKLKRA